MYCRALYDKVSCGFMHPLPYFNFKTMHTLDDRIKNAIHEEIALVPYDPAWPLMFEREKRHLLSCLPCDLVRRIEHFGSTAIPGMAAKPVIDMLVEVSSLDETKARVVPVLEEQGYDYFWRPTWGDDTPPYYAWFIKRDASGRRTHHIHMVERHFEHWERLLFRDYLIAHPAIARDYQALKLTLAAEFPSDRVAYTKGKSEFITRVTQAAKEEPGNGDRPLRGEPDHS
jgi:GrpB-like predicted nucleotidyltransferase (UPF0157 family)